MNVFWKEEMTDEEIDKAYHELFEKYVPMTGVSDTIGGEIVRAYNRLAYRWYNDGDMIGKGYGKHTCNAAARFLRSVVMDEVISDKIEELWKFVGADDEYENGLYELGHMLLKYLKDRTALFELKNETDMWNFRKPEDEEDDEEEYEDEYEEEEYEDEDEEYDD